MGPDVLGIDFLEGGDSGGGEMGGCGWSGFTGRVGEGEGQDERERESKFSHSGRAPINSYQPSAVR